MGKGLKQMVSEALAQAQAEPELPPVEVSAEATRMLAEHLRKWAGWPKARLVFGDPRPVSPWASTDHDTFTFKANIDTLLLNPNRVLMTVTPFRMRQEAVLTGALLHEAGHARHSKWLPRNEEQAHANPLVHSDGTVPTAQTVALARLFEEPRVEGLMYRDADRIGASGLAWTMRAMAAHVLPATTLPKDPNTAIMALVRSWLLRAGRQYAIASWDGNHQMRRWVADFTSMVHSAIATHLMAQGIESPQNMIDAKTIMEWLVAVVSVTDDTGPTLIDTARDVLALLFPETDPEDQPQPQGGCTMSDEAEEEQPEDSDDEGESQPGGDSEGEGDDEAASESGEGGEGDEEGEQGEGNTEPEDEGSGEEPGAGDSGEDEDAEPEDEGESDKSEQDSEDSELAKALAEDEGEQESEEESEEEAGGASASTEQAETDDTSELAKALAAMEARVGDESEDEAQEEAEEAETEAGSGAGAGSGGAGSGGWRKPTAEEREIQKGAERFLRDLISPSEASKVTLTESPSATVDGAALAAWKAGGQVRDPRFFVRTRRTIEPSPPVQIATLCDVSGSMDELQKPTAVLSWALSNAALDLRNFAGRGQQVESTLIHWGSNARVVQRNGETLPGLREWDCTEYTTAMGEALALVEQEIPGFYEVKDKPVNRLLVCFTDWELWNNTVPETTTWIGRALEAGVNIISVVPQDYGYKSRRFRDRSVLNDILRNCHIQRGRHSLLKYNPMFPAQVWDHAAKALAVQ